MSSSQDSEEINKLHRIDFQGRDFGGTGPHIRIVTTDEATIIVSSQVLSNASAVFKGMIETCSTDEDTTPTLELTDEAEDYGSVETLVEWMVGGRDEIDRQGLNDQSEDIIWLAKKYECLDILGWLELKMYREIISEPQGRYCSINIVIALGAWPLVGQIISDTEMYTGIAHWWWSLKTTLDPRAWSPEDFKRNTRFGHIFTWGITQSALEAHHPERGLDYKRMGQIFTDIMLKAEKNQRYVPANRRMQEIAPSPGNPIGKKRRREIGDKLDAMRSNLAASPPRWS